MPMCRTCSADKPRSEFYRQPSTKSGIMLDCKDCHKERVRARARTNPKVQEYDRMRAKTPKRKAHLRRVSKKWREENPIAYRAQTAVNNAVRDGRLFKAPCAICGANRVHAHHKDYSKPLDVIWLCPKCHHRLHAVFPEIEGVHKQAR